MWEWEEDLTSQELLPKLLSIPREIQFHFSWKVINALSFSLHLLVKPMRGFMVTWHANEAWHVDSKDEFTCPCNDQGGFIVHLTHMDQMDQV